ncbi:serine protease inhibitor 3/4 isoform X4 [Ooceraea biroi]|uniref:serine protease inhibitor 3/4 isoform X4 n=1 Tax=Ooceraea biroi TaxID=2015173 RepID=UPI0005B830C2|nr:serine protease inhibitor 3/4 isoform X4 [Ooceraea biroi]
MLWVNCDLSSRQRFQFRRSIVIVTFRIFELCVIVIIFARGCQRKVKIRHSLTPKHMCTCDILADVILSMVKAWIEPGASVSCLQNTPASALRNTHISRYFYLQKSFLAFCLIASAMAHPTVSSNPQFQIVSQGANLFSTNFVKAIAKDQQQQENLICSPLSLTVALSMAAVGSAGNTEAQFKEVLKLPASKTESLAGYQTLIDTLNNVENVTLKLANKMFIAENFAVKPEYKQNLQTYYHSDIDSVNFGEPQKAADTINAWCKEKTNDRIDGVVTPNDVGPSTALVLANAVYFKGNWATQFDPLLTSDRPFHVDASTVKNVPTMFRKGNYKFAELPQYEAKCIELPYANKDISMVIILPDKVDGLPALTERLDEVTNECNNLLSRAYEREIEVFLPKFKTEVKMQLGDLLTQKMGLTEPFSDGANFSGISDVPLKISKVIQKAFIEVNEEGSEAAAVTVSEICLESDWEEQLVFDVDRPFHYYIYYNNWMSYISLFEGRVIMPEILPVNQ